jgi:hypothetical protein
MYFILSGVRAVREPEVLAVQALPAAHEAIHSLHQGHSRGTPQHEVGSPMDYVFSV